MVDKEDWINWDNSMKSHIDQVEVKWKNELVLAMEKSAEIDRLQHRFNKELIDEIERQADESKRNTIYIAVCICLLTINLVVGLMAFQEALKP
jgi:hypothetical protein